MKIKSLVLAAALVLFSGAAFAQESNRDANGKIQYGPYETNKFFDNWFIGVGGGINWGQDGVEEKLFNGKPEAFKGGLGLNISVYAGKWVDPCWGFRLGWSGLKNTDLRYDSDFPGNVNYNYFHLDGLVNLSNLFAGYKETRTVNFVVYPHVGFINNPFKGIKHSFAAGAGLMIPIRISNLINIVPDIRYDILPSNTAQVLNCQTYHAGNLTAALALQFNLQRNNWTRKATTVAGFTSALAASEALRAAAQAKNDELAAANEAALKEKEQLAKENQDLKDELAREKELAAGMYNIDLAVTPIRVFFQLNKATLTPQELAHLDFYVKTIISAHPDSKLVINGECDSKTGSAKTNQKLSERRAKYLYNLLTDKYGLSADRFEVNPCGGIDEYTPFILNRACEVGPVKK